ncbi:phospholipase A2 [Patulibacter americanus]|uniref:phospholipase A2 n=1 Tax=Patulibacter americanus TaxID=588672 RepID=UPI0003B499B3|nr:phospholipase A2 [Patulibacter americanus]
MSPSPSPSTLRRLAVVGLAVTAAATLPPAAASAARVTAPGPWQAANRYLVQTNLDGRAAPKLEPRAKVDHVKQGQWVRIECQTTGEAAYGSTVWTRVRGLYVPDAHLKTYTDGFIPGVPRCDQAPPKPKGPSRAKLARIVEKVAYEQVYGPRYGRYYNKFRGKIIWDKNGCSVPKAILEIEVGAGGWLRGKPVSYYAGLFQKSCDRHDFGYRNYGSNSDGLKLDPTESRRASIDTRFGSNMDHQCEEIFDREYVEALQRGLCFKAADAFQTAVQQQGQDHFF